MGNTCCRAFKDVFGTIVVYGTDADEIDYWPAPEKQEPDPKVVVVEPPPSPPPEIESMPTYKTENIKDHYTLRNKLGTGTFGTVRLCIEKVTGKTYACKTIAKSSLTSDEEVEDVHREIVIMHRLSGHHPNIISIKEAYEDDISIHLVMDLCSGSSLCGRFSEGKRYTEREAAELSRVIASVVEACHSVGVMHRDLKLDNFLFANKNETAAELVAIDFGYSVFFRPGDVFTDQVGTSYYMAPEVLGESYGPEADVWSAGVTIYFLLSGYWPFFDETDEGIEQEILSATLDLKSEPWPSISESAKDLVRKMLVRDPSKRLTARQVLCHPWLSSGS